MTTLWFPVSAVSRTYSAVVAGDQAWLESDVPDSLKPIRLLAAHLEEL